MKPTFNTNMFESIKTALETAKSKTGNAKFKDILKLEAPATYVVRLLPNIKAPGETFFHYYHHGWNSINTGQYVNIVSPSTWGERCPVSELFFKILRDGSDEDKKRAKENISRKENWLVNVYVVDDPKNPENNGTIKMLRYGRQLNKIIESAISGDDAEEFGPKIFDLGPNGCNLRIKAERVSEKPGAPQYPSYTSSRFLSPSAITGLDESKFAEIYEGIHDLSSMIEHKSTSEIQDFIQTHYFGQTSETEDGEASSAAAQSAAQKANTVEEDVSYETPAKPEPVKQSGHAKQEVPAAAAASVKSILDELEDV